MNQNKSEILERLDRGEISPQAAIRALSEETAHEPEAIPAPLPVPVSPPVPETSSSLESPAILTRRERLSALTERVRDWDPRHMVTLSPTPRPWPWPEQRYQWLWQDFDHPVHVDHALDLAEGCGLSVVVYDGDLNLTGDDGPLRIGAAAFDLRVGRDENTVRVAAATGALDLRVPKAVAHIEARALPGDLRIRGLRVQQLRIEGESGDLRCEDLVGDVEAHLRGGDADLRNIEGDIALTVSRGDIRVREVRSTRVHLTAGGGISLSLGPVNRGDFRCEADDGDVELFLPRDAACSLFAEALDGGTICPSELPWTDLSERSRQTLKGALGGGGATIHLVTKGGRIFITGR